MQVVIACEHNALLYEQDTLLVVPIPGLLPAIMTAFRRLALTISGSSGGSIPQVLPIKQGPIHIILAPVVGICARGSGLGPT